MFAEARASGGPPPSESAPVPRLGPHGTDKLRAVESYREMRAVGRGAEAVAVLGWASATDAHRTRQLAVRAEYEAVCQESGTVAWPPTPVSVTDWLVSKVSAEPRARDYYGRALGLLRSLALLTPELGWPLTESEASLLDAVCKTLSGATPASVPRRATPATAAVLRAIHAHWQGTVMALSDVMIWVVLRVCAQAVTRSGDVVRLQWSDVWMEDDPSGERRVYLRWVEEKRERERVSILLPHAGQEATSGHQAMLDWMALPQVAERRRVALAAPDDAVYRWVFPRIHPRTGAVLWQGGDEQHPHLTQEQFSGRVRRLAETAQVAGAERLTGHAGRRGGATDLEAAGASEMLIMSLGGWAGPESMRRYLDPGALVRARDAVRLLVGQQPQAPAGASAPRGSTPPPPGPAEGDGVEVVGAGPTAGAAPRVTRPKRPAPAVAPGVGGGSGARPTPRPPGVPADLEAYLNAADPDVEVVTEDELQRELFADMGIGPGLSFPMPQQYKAWHSLMSNAARR
jgi:hypothetical protein